MKKNKRSHLLKTIFLVKLNIILDDIYQNPIIFLTDRKNYTFNCLKASDYVLL
jgi:hypothetical protein